MLNKYILFLLLFLLLPSLAQAGGYEKTITKIGDSQVPNGKMQISADGKFLYVCNTNGNFAKFDIEKGEVVDTMKLPAQGSTYHEVPRRNYFMVDKYEKHLIYTDSKINVYDFNTKSLIHSYSCNGGGNYSIPEFWSLIDSKKDSLIIIGSLDYRDEESGGISFGRVAISNYLNKTEIKTHNYSQVVQDMQISNDGKNILTLSEYEKWGWSMHEYYSVTVSSFGIFNDTLGVKTYFFNDNQETYYNNLYSMGLDNTGDIAYFFRRNGLFTVYSISQKKILLSELRPVLYTDFNFLSNDKYYIASIYANKDLRIYTKNQHFRCDEIKLENNIMNVLTSKDSNSIYILNDIGEIFEVVHDLIGTEPKALLSSDKRELLLGDTITLYDNSIGKFDSRKWFINGTEQSDTSENFKYVPTQSGLHSVELQVLSGSEMKNIILADFFNVYKSIKADFTYQIEDFKDSLGVSFTNLSLGDSLHFKWLFGDGASSEEMNPYHYYTKKGIYIVRLIAYNNYFADTVLAKEEIFFRMKNILDITQKSNRQSGSSKYYDPKEPNVYGINGFWLNNKICGFNVNIYANYNNNVTIDSKSFQINDDSITEMTSNNFHYDIFDPVEFRLNTTFVNDSIYFLTANRQLDFLGKFYSYFEYYKSNSRSNEKVLLYKRYSDLPEFPLNSFNLRLKEDLIFLSINYFDKNKSPKSDFLKINTNTLEIDTSTIDIKFNFGLPDHDKGKIKLVSDENNTVSVYEYSESLGLKKVFDLDNFDSILYVDQNLKRNRMLFVSKGRKAVDTTLTLTITDFNGNTLGKRILDSMKLIRDIKFVDDFILISPYYGKVDLFDYVNYGNFELLVYDGLGNYLQSYKDNLIYNGSINNITHLSGNRALLVGTKFQKFDYFTNKSIPSQSEIYYIVDLDKLDSVPNDDPGKIDVSTIRCSPNPTNGDITFNFENEGNQTVRIKIIDPMGNELATLETSSDYVSFPAASLGSGIYFVRGIVGGKSISGKFVVAR